MVGCCIIALGNRKWFCVSLSLSLSLCTISETVIRRYSNLIECFLIFRIDTALSPTLVTFKTSLTRFDEMEPKLATSSICFGWSNQMVPILAVLSRLTSHPIGLEHQNYWTKSLRQEFLVY